MIDAKTQPPEPHLVNADEFALTQALQENYLGNPEVIEVLLRDFGRRAIARFDADHKEESVAVDAKDCANMADIFLGNQPKDYPPMLWWNKPGCIDEFVSTQIGVTGSPEYVMTALFAMFISDAYSVYNFACEPGALDEQWDWLPDAITEQYLRILIGYLEPTTDEATLQLVNQE